MGVVDKLLKAAEASEKRLEAARVAVAALTKEERERLLVELVRQVDRPDVDAPTPSRTDLEPVQEPAEGSFVDACEAALAANPRGLTSAEIGAIIGQDRQRADSTVRWLQRSRKNVGRDGDRWVLLRSSAKPVTNRDLIKRVLADAGRPLRAGEIVAGVKAINPEANENTLHAEFMRLRNDLDEIARSPGKPPTGGLYSLKRGGASK